MCTPERLAAWEKLDPSNKTIPRHRAKLAVLLGDPVKGAGLYLALGDETSAVLAYGIAGEERLAWETARQAKNFRALRNYHALLMFLALERKFASPRSALDWLDRIAAQAKPGERVHLDRTPAIRLHRALLYRETGRKAEALRILEKLRAEERKRSRSGGALYNRLYENDRKLLERTVAILRKSLPGRVRQELQKRGISRELWDDALSQLPPQGNAIDDFLRRRFRGAKPDQKELKRATDALLRRGHSWSDIRSALERYVPEEELPDE